MTGNINKRDMYTNEILKARCLEKQNRGIIATVVLLHIILKIGIIAHTKILRHK